MCLQIILIFGNSISIKPKQRSLIFFFKDLRSNVQAEILLSRNNDKIAEKQEILEQFLHTFCKLFSLSEQKQLIDLS